jgi:hypothetical protein
MKWLVLIGLLMAPLARTMAMLPDEATESQTSSASDKETILDVECEPDDPACVA